jgi:hypothetical protein
MPRAAQDELSDEDYDELIDEEEGDEEEAKPSLDPLYGAIVRPRHITLSCKQLHGESIRAIRRRGQEFSARIKDCAELQTRFILVRWNFAHHTNVISFGLMSR